MKKKSKPKSPHRVYKCIIIHWLDAVASSGWTSETHGLHEIITMGFLIEETKLSYLIASTISNDETNCRIAVPKAWVKKKRIIKL